MSYPDYALDRAHPYRNCAQTHLVATTSTGRYACTLWSPQRNTARCVQTTMLDDSYAAAPSVISIRSELDIIAARMEARDIARRMGFHTVDQARIATATSELTRNILMYAGEGEVVISGVHRAEASQQRGLELVFRDSGPGIANIEDLLQPTRNGKQMLGLAGSLRMMDEVHINTIPGTGTTIVCRKWLP